jgi:hypothetical protein
MNMSSADYKARDDAQALLRAAEIRADTKRFKAAQKAASALAAERQKEADRLAGFAGSFQKGA